MLIADTIRARRIAILAWIVSGAAFMVVIAFAYEQEVDAYPGGTAAMGAALEAAAQAMRLMRWPAERLDTFGGYITYHNVVIFALALGLWGAVQGARLVRGAQAEGSLEQILATGCSRGRALAGRVGGFVVALTLIALGIGGGLAAATAIAGVYDLSGSIITMVSVGFCALACFGLALAASQLTGTPRFAAGLATAVITGLYLLNNVWEELGWLGKARFVSPFYYFSQSRALVPGRSVDLGAMAALLAMAIGAIAIAAWAFKARDIWSPLWARKQRAGRKGTAEFEAGSLGNYWRAESARQKVGLLAWSVGAAAITAVMAWLEPVVADMWEEFGLFHYTGASASSMPLVDQYMSFAAELVAAVVAGYVIAQAAGWVAEMRDGRVEMYLANPVSWQRLILERLATLTIGVAAITVGAIAGLFAGALAADAPLDPTGLMRTALDTVLLGLALGGAGAMLVAWLRTGISVILLTVALFGSYLFAFVVPLFDWPDWLINLTVFGAYGRPYLEVPDVVGVLLLIALALGGAFIAPMLADRRPKIP